MVKVGIVGCNGRMGRLIAQEIFTSPACTLAGATVRVGNPLKGQDLGTTLGGDPLNIAIHTNIEKLFKDSDVVIDFTTPQASVSHAGYAAENGTAYVIGTTGLNGAQEEALKQSAKKSRIIYAANMSLGVNLLAALVEKAAQSLMDDFDIEVLEMHHNKKKDAPSGTALMLGEMAAKGRKHDLRHLMASGNRAGERKKGSIGFAVLRGGGVAGDHEVVFASEDEMITLSHRALDRRLFAKGAVRAALWGAQHKHEPGLFHMRDVLGL